MSKRKRKRIFVDTSQIHKKKGKADQALRLAKSNRKHIRQTTDIAVCDITSTAGTLNATRTVTHIDLGNTATTNLDGEKAYLKTFKFDMYI